MMTCKIYHYVTSSLQKVNAKIDAPQASFYIVLNA
jgi:hypothetical protein